MPRAGRHSGPLPGPFRPVLGVSKHPHQPEGAPQAMDTRSWVAGETEASGGDRSPQGTQESGGVRGRGLLTARTVPVLRQPSELHRVPELPAPPGASEAFPAPRCSPEALGGPTEGGGPDRRLEAGWPSHTVSAGRLTRRLLPHSLRLPSPHLTPPGFCRWALFFLGV